MGRPPRQFPKCGKEGCDKNARHGTGFCVGHGGGNRCGMKGCDKSAQGRMEFCAGHRGGKCNMRRRKAKNFKASTAAAGSHSVRVSDARATI